MGNVTGSMNEQRKVPKLVEHYLDEISYGPDPDYVPSDFALEFVAFIKLVNGEEGEENMTPVMHMKMLDQVASGEDSICNMCARGTAKTTVLGEYLFLYIAVYGRLPGLGDLNLALYVSDSIENGVKNMRKNLEYRWENSEFLQRYIPYTRFTDIRWEFKNIEGKTFIVKGYGAKTGVRGAKEQAVRPQLAVLDDLVSDEDARSATVIQSIEDTVHKAIDYALHPTRKMTIWSGTPFNARDPLYKAVESGAWRVNVYPICEEFPVEKGDFRGCWEDRFTYEYVKRQYEKASLAGKIDTFNQELMLRIMSEEDRMIQDSDIVWYSVRKVLENKSSFNFYITTDFATGTKSYNDYSVISVWAYSSNGEWLWVDGICAKQDMSQNIKDLFRFAQMYQPKSVGVEISGQQKGFISWIQNEMITRNIYFTLASDKNSTELGIRPNTNKMERFNVVEPWFKLKRIWFPEEYRQEPPMQEAINELQLAAKKGFRSKHDDFIDTISMLGALDAWKPSRETPKMSRPDKYWDEWEDSDQQQTLDNYLV